MLESLEQSNIKRMSVEKPERQEIPFDAEKVLTTKDWLDMESFLKKSEEELKKSNPKTANFSHIVYAMRLLRPEQDLQLSDATSRIIGRNFPELGLETLVRLKSILNSLKIKPASNWSWFNTQLRDHYSRQGIVEEMNMASVMKQIDRNQPENWQIPLNKIKERLDFFREQSDWEEFTQLAANMRIVSEKPIKLEISDWEGMQGALLRLRENLEKKKDPELLIDIFSQTAEMKILAAKEIKYSDEGLELVMPDLSQAPPKEFLPEQRNF